MLIGLNGRKQAGKDTAYSRIAVLYGACGARVERASFADLLYESAAALLNVPVAVLQAGKADPAARVRVTLGPPHGVQSELTIREYLQRYGTEAHRDVFGTNFWTEQVDLRHEDKIVVVTDVRFPNEARVIRDKGGHVVRLAGPMDVELAGDGHASETPLPHSLVDFTITNDVRGDGFANLDTQLRALLGRLLREAQ